MIFSKYFDNVSMHCSAFGFELQFCIIKQAVNARSSASCSYKNSLILIFHSLRGNISSLINGHRKYTPSTAKFLFFNCCCCSTTAFDAAAAALSSCSFFSASNSRLTCAFMAASDVLNSRFVFC